MKYGFPLLLLAIAACTPQSKSGTQVPVVQETAPPLVASQRDIVSKGAIAPGTPAVKVAMLLPLSGDSATVGNAMLDAASMALYDNYLAVPSDQIHSQVILLPKDSGTTPADAVKAAKQAIDQGATFIVGPLFAQSVSAIAPIAKERNIPVLSFSNNMSVASENVFTFGFLPEQQVKRVSDYAYLHNLQRVALMAPNDAYGQKIQTSLKDVYTKKGGVVSPTELYAPSPANIDAAASRLATTYNNSPEERRFQAIFIADGGNQLKNIVSSLKKTNIDLKKVKLLGTGLWDDPSIANIPELQGAWFSSSTPDNSREFERRFMAIYNYKPVRLASLAYDALTLLSTTTMSSSQTTVNTSALLDPKGYMSPANGLFRLRPDGTSERRLAIIEVSDNTFKVVDPARKIFEDDEALMPAAGTTTPPATAPAPSTKE
jgi:branched-chain amino acid transport system substrate-binding protein